MRTPHPPSTTPHPSHQGGAPTTRGPAPCRPIGLTLVQAQVGGET